MQQRTTSTITTFLRGFGQMAALKLDCYRRVHSWTRPSLGGNRNDYYDNWSARGMKYRHWDRL